MILRLGFVELFFFFLDKKIHTYSIVVFVFVCLSHLQDSRATSQHCHSMIFFFFIKKALHLSRKKTKERNRQGQCEEMSDCVKENQSVREKKNQNFFFKIILTWKFMELSKKVGGFSYIYILVIDPCVARFYKKSYKINV